MIFNEYRNEKVKTEVLATKLERIKTKDIVELNKRKTELEKDFNNNGCEVNVFDDRSCKAKQKEIERIKSKINDANIEVMNIERKIK